MTFILSKTITKFLCIVVTSIFASYIILYFNFGAPSLDALFGVSLGFTAIFSTVLSIGSKKVLKKSCAMILAHIGLGLTIIGVTIVSKYEIEKDVKISIGETVAISDYEVKFKEISETDGDNYIGHTGHFDISKFGRKIATLYPEKRLFVVQEVAMSETAILPGLFRDIYLALGEQFDKKTWSARVYYKPLVRWIWGGALLMVIGICLPVIISWRDK